MYTSLRTKYYLETTISANQKYKFLIFSIYLKKQLETVDI